MTEQELEPPAKPFIIAITSHKKRATHRLGWLKATGIDEAIIIDSSARRAYVPSSIPSDQQYKVSKVTFPDASSCLLSSSAEANRTDRFAATDGESIGDVEREAMKICLKQLLGNDQGIVVACLRLVRGQLVGFHGLINWRPGQRSLSLRINGPAAAHANRRVVTWDGKGNLETARDAHSLVNGFLD